MATVNYSVPDEVKQEFNRLFSSENKSQIITELMLQAIEEYKIKKQRRKAISKLLQLRDVMPKVSTKKLAALRSKDRP